MSIFNDCFQIVGWHLLFLSPFLLKDNKLYYINMKSKCNVKSEKCINDKPNNIYTRSYEMHFDNVQCSVSLSILVSYIVAMFCIFVNTTTI